MITASTARLSPGLALIGFTVPSRSARSTFSIFIASTTASVSPALTSWPSVDRDRDAPGPASGRAASCRCRAGSSPASAAPPSPRARCRRRPSPRRRDAASTKPLGTGRTCTAIGSPSIVPAPHRIARLPGRHERHARPGLPSGLDEVHRDAAAPRARRRARSRLARADRRGGARASRRGRPSGRRCGACARRARGRWRRRPPRSFAPRSPSGGIGWKPSGYSSAMKPVESLPARQRGCCISADRNGMLWRMPSMTKASSASACAVDRRRARSARG